MKINSVCSFLFNCLDKAYSLGKSFISKTEKVKEEFFSSQLRSEEANRDTILRKQSDTIAWRVKNEHKRNRTSQDLACNTTLTGAELIEKVSISSLRDSRDKKIVEHDDSYSILPSEMKIRVCTLLDVASLNALSRRSQKTYEFINSDKFFRNKTLCDLAITMLSKLQSNVFEKDDMIRAIVTIQAQYGDIKKAQETATLIVGNYYKSRALREIAIAQVKYGGDVKEVEKAWMLLEETALQIESDYQKCTVVREIAMAQAAYLGDNTVLEATLTLLKDIALSIDDPKEKYNELQEIALIRTQYGMPNAEDTILLIDNDSDRSSALIKVSMAQFQLQDVDGAKKTLLKARDIALDMDLDDISRCFLLENIITAQIASNDREEAKKTCALIKNQALLIKNAPLQVAFLLWVAEVQVTNNDTEEAKRTLDLAKNRALVIEDDVLEVTGLAFVAEVQAEYGDIAEAEKIFCLLENNVQKARVLKAIAGAQYKNNNIENARKTLLLLQQLTVTSEYDCFQLNLGEIAAFQADCGDITGARDTVILIEDCTTKSFIFEEIARAQLRNGDALEAKKTFGLSRDEACLIDIPMERFNRLKGVATAQAASGDIDGARSTSLLIEDNEKKLFTLIAIAVFQAQNGNKDEAKKALNLIREETTLIEDVEQTSLLQKIAQTQAQIGDILGVKGTIASMRMRKHFDATVQTIIQVIDIMDR